MPICTGSTAARAPTCLSTWSFRRSNCHECRADIRVCSVPADRNVCSTTMKSMILAAGFGTRFRPVTYTLPKPMVPLLNKPLIAWAVDSLIAAGTDEIIVNLHHLPEALERYLTEAYAGRVTFRFSFEEEILGTGGGVRRVRPHLENETDFFLVNGDTVQFPRWEELLDARRRRDSLAAITLRHPPAHDRFTPVFLDDGLVSGFGKGGGEAL